MTTLHKHSVFTIPNLLSMLRLALIPLIVHLYGINAPLSAAILLLSGLTDLLDGWYARRFNAVTSLGKVLDPIADKLTQFAVLILLSRKFTTFIPLIILLVIKELIAGTLGAVVIQRTGLVHGAEWHGKAAGFLLYLLMLLHIVWKDIPASLSNILAVVCAGMMLLSLTLYSIAHIHRCQKSR